MFFNRPIKFGRTAYTVVAVLIALGLPIPTAFSKLSFCRDDVIIGIIPVTGIENPASAVWVSSVLQSQKYPTMVHNLCKDLKVRTVILPHDLNMVQEYINLIDGLILVGGTYKSPEEYELQTYMSTKTGTLEQLNALSAKIEYNNEFETKIINSAMQENIPIIAIDAGMHMISIALGGTVGIIPRNDKTKIIHGANATSSLHEININRQTTLFNMVGHQEVKNVLSSHARALTSAPKGAQVAAISEDGVIEAIEWSKPGGAQRFIFGFQWHLEESSKSGDGLTYTIIRKFCKAANSNNAGIRARKEIEEQAALVVAKGKADRKARSRAIRSKQIPSKQASPMASQNVKTAFSEY